MTDGHDIDANPTGQEMPAGEAAGNAPTCSYWTKQRAAAYLDVQPYTIDYLVRTGRLPHYKICGKRRFTRADLDAYATANRVGKTVAKEIESPG